MYEKSNPDIPKLKRELEELEKIQKELTTESRKLNDNVRTIRDELTIVETAKINVSFNQQKIDLLLQDISDIQKNIQAELNKLTTEVRSIAVQSTDTAKTPDGPPPPPPLPGGAPPPPPPPPPPGGSSSTTQKKAPIDKKVEKPSAVDTKSTAGSMPQIDQSELGSSVGGKNLKSSSGRKVEEDPAKILADRAEKMRKGNAFHKTNIENLSRSIKELHSKLETARVNAPGYKEALQSQGEILEALNKRKADLDSKFKSISGQVSEALLEMKKKREEELAAKQAAIVSDMPPPPPPPSGGPPPPPPPPMGKNTAPKKPAEHLDNTKPDTSSEEKKKTASSSNEKPPIDQEELSNSAEQRSHKQSLIQRLINLVISEADFKIDNMNWNLTQRQKNLMGLLDENFEFVENDDFEEVLIAPIYTQLKDEMIQSLSSDKDKKAQIESGLASLNAANTGGEKTLERIRAARENPNLRQAVATFIDKHPNKEALIQFSIEESLKEEKEIEAQRVLEQKKNAEAAEKAAEILKAEKLTSVQETLAKQGITEAVIDTQEVERARLKKEEVIEGVSAKKSTLTDVDNFLNTVDNLLSQKMNELQKAEEHRIEVEKQAELEAEKQAELEEKQQPEQIGGEEPVVDIVPVLDEEPEHVETHSVDEEPEHVETHSVDEEPERVEMHSVDEEPEHVEMHSVDEEPERVETHSIGGEDRPTQEAVEARRQKLKEMSVEVKGKLVSVIDILVEIKTAANNLQTKSTKESAQFNKICNKLLNSAEKFIETGDKKQFIKACDEAIKPEAIKPKEGIFNWLKRKAQSIKEAFTGKSELTQTIENKNDAVTKMKKALEDMKSGEEEHQKNVEVRSGPTH